jgi:hypothetical protein
MNWISESPRESGSSDRRVGVSLSDGMDRVAAADNQLCANGLLS